MVETGSLVSPGLGRKNRPEPQLRVLLGDQIWGGWRDVTQGPASCPEVSLWEGSVDLTQRRVMQLVTWLVTL